MKMLHLIGSLTLDCITRQSPQLQVSIAQPGFIFHLMNSNQVSCLRVVQVIDLIFGVACFLPQYSDKTFYIWIYGLLYNWRWKKKQLTRILVLPSIHIFKRLVSYILNAIISLHDILVDIFTGFFPDIQNI